MALTIESLKGLYEKLGGEDFGDVTTIPEAIDKVTEVAEGGGGGSGAMVVTLTPTETENQYTADTDAEDIVTAFNAKTPVYVYDTEGNCMLQVFIASNDIIIANIMTPADITGGLRSVGVLTYQTGNSRAWVKSDTEYAVNDGKPLNVEIASVSGMNVTISTPASVINAAFLAHTPVYCDIVAPFYARSYLQICNYTDANDYYIKFSSVVPDSNGSIKVYWVIFDHSLTGELRADTIYTPNP